MAQAATNPKIEELRGKLKADPKSRLFYQLAEELRKSGHPVDSEQVLRNGLTSYPTYLAAWVSLGRVCRELKNDGGAVEALNKALQLDPGNVVAARLLGDAYLALGERVEAIKKYKLVHAILPADEELNAQIRQLEQELSPPALAVVDQPAVFDDSATSFAEPETELSAAEPATPEAPVASSPDYGFAESPSAFSEADSDPQPQPAWSAREQAVVSGDEPLPQSAGSVTGAVEDSPFDRTMPPFGDAAEVFANDAERAEATGDVEPMSAAHSESPFEDPVEYTAASVEIEGLSGMQVVEAPLAAEVAQPFGDDDLPVIDSAPVFDTPHEAVAGSTDDASATLTMADLYVGQGLIEEARHIYENLLARDPDNEDVRARLSAIAPRVNAKVVRLERWLSRMTRKGEAGV